MQVEEEGANLDTTLTRGIDWSSGSAHAALLGTAYGPGLEFEDRRLVPRLAERWEVSPDAKTFTFHLRRDVSFPPVPPVNGRAFTSDDVAWSYEYISRTGRLNEKKVRPSLKAFMFSGLEKIETPDSATVVVRFKDPYVAFLNYAAENEVYAQETFDEAAGSIAGATGLGPYTYDQAASQKGARWVYKKNSAYLETGHPYFDEVHHLYLQSDATVEAAFLARQLDIHVPEGENQAQGMARHQGAKSFVTPSGRFSHFYINSRHPHLNDVRVRRAFSLAINRDEIIKTIFGGKGGWALAGGDRTLFTQEEVKQIIPYDLDEAKRLVAEAGYPNGVTIDWMVTREYGDVYISRAELIQAQMKRANINLVLRPMSSSVEINSIRRTPDGHQITASNNSSTPDLGYNLERQYSPGSSNNYGGVNDPDLTALIRAQAAEVDPERRRELVRRAMRIINGEKVYGLATTYEPAYVVWQANLANVHPNIWAGYRRIAIDSVWRE